jgi:hypothetical protein
MERAIEVNDDGVAKTLVGLTVCEGPATYRLLLTRPHQQEGQIVEIPYDAIESIHNVEPGPRGDPPEIAND